jgi:hypothetical protein
VWGVGAECCLPARVWPAPTLERGTGWSLIIWWRGALCGSGINLGLDLCLYIALALARWRNIALPLDVCACGAWCVRGRGEGWGAACFSVYDTSVPRRLPHWPPAGGAVSASMRLTSTCVALALRNRQAPRLGGAGCSRATGGCARGDTGALHSRGSPSFQGQDGDSSEVGDDHCVDSGSGGLCRAQCTATTRGGRSNRMPTTA